MWVQSYPRNGPCMCPLESFCRLCTKSHSLASATMHIEQQLSRRNGVPGDDPWQRRNGFIVELQNPMSRSRRSDSWNQTIPTMMTQWSSHQCLLCPNQDLCSPSLPGHPQPLQSRNPNEGTCLAVDVVGTWT